MATTTYGDIYVPCEQCGHMNTLRQVPEIRALSREETFVAQVREIVNELGGVLTSREIARHVAGRILALFNPVTHGGRPSYMIQVFSEYKWHDIDGATLTHLL